ncbi:MAG: S1C family serine protease [Gammaproteobacteria bacterium]
MNSKIIKIIKNNTSKFVVLLFAIFYLPICSAERISYASPVQKAAPAVVSIRTSKIIPVETHPLLQDPMLRHFFGFGGPGSGFGMEPESGLQEELQQGLGSGVIVDSKGYVLTNNHVIKEADSISVALADGRKADAKIIGSDPETDLAVLKIDLDQLPSIALGNSSTLKTGDVVLAIGNPFGLDQTVTQGIVSAPQRSYKSLGILSNLIQTDAAINPGNSGGALIDTDGTLIGINTAIISQSGGYQGIGFAVPIDVAKDIMEQLKTGKKVARGWLGVSLQELSPEVKENLKFKENIGVYVHSVVQSGPAYKAGLLPGDIITKIGDAVVENGESAQQLVAKLIPGKTAAIEVFRSGTKIKFSVQITDRSEMKNMQKKYKQKKRSYYPEEE